MTFWDWALAAYARPGVEPACLTLQDRHGQSAPYLLWAGWAAAHGSDLSAETLQAAARLAARWDTEVLSGLRQARRNMKAPFGGLDDGKREALRSEVKAIELEVEQTLMLALEQMAPAPSIAARPLEAALIEAVSAWHRPAPTEALRPLAQALG